ncbi:MAG: phospholipase D-like domain-containing protein, partial [Bacteroidota bacterium]
LLRNARKRCYLALAYFVPPPWLIEELVAAAGRGVDVRVMTAGDTDLPHAREGGRHVYGDLLKGGVRLFELQEPRLHAKNATVDGRFAQVGTFDFNAFTRRYSLEVTVVVESVAIARGLEETFAANSVRSKEIDLDEWEQRGSVRRLVQKACHRLFFLPGGAANGTHRPS